MQHIEKIKLLLVVFGLPVLLYLITKAYREYEAKEILRKPAFAVGVLTEIGRNTAVEYKVAGKTYSFKRRQPEDLLQGRIIGDTVFVIYCQTDPDNADLKKGFSRRFGN
ncbi:hypothetical protein GCM10011378_10750 [Hymenobacter glacieicola]|uniref:DUF3592 domain-containing protein n=1 Tax=Hymenobacter glacieicola TaxID=1562124 RepID=A0ABQ1WLY4_9BACT|nr:hypothetical protein GCM10011378_10750 [Hymenobacter glacieicola]